MGREDRRKLEQHFCNLGGRIATVRKSGAVRYSHRLVSRSVRCNNRRKDAPQVFVDFVREVERAIQEAAAPPSPALGAGPPVRSRWRERRGRFPSSNTCSSFRRGQLRSPDRHHVLDLPSATLIMWCSGCSQLYFFLLGR